MESSLQPRPRGRRLPRRLKVLAGSEICLFNNSDRAKKQFRGPCNDILWGSTKGERAQVPGIQTYTQERPEVELIKMCPNSCVFHSIAFLFPGNLV